jgi:hypothetical protein
MTGKRPLLPAYDYRRLDVRSDDDEEYYLAIAYSESLSAWRLHDGRWLVHRRVEPLGEEDARPACSASTIGCRAEIDGRRRAMLGDDIEDGRDRARRIDRDRHDRA